MTLDNVRYSSRVADIGAGMSDGPHRSLEMRKGWKRVAESADNRAFEPAEVRVAMAYALEEDCRGEMAGDFIKVVHKICEDQRQSLFGDALVPKLESLRNDAGSGIGRVLVEYAIKEAVKGKSGTDVLSKALNNALRDRSARNARQVEEHYYRKSTAKRATNVRSRMENAIGSTDFSGISQRILNPNTKGSDAKSLKREGLDDGVKL
jgi:hypothetical protein